MSLPRSLARRLLRFAAGHAGPDRDWAMAMRVELDVVEGDWAALRWAAGGTTALGRRSVRRMRLSRPAVLLAAAVVAVVCVGLLRRPVRHTRHAAWADAVDATAAAPPAPGSPLPR